LESATEDEKNCGTEKWKTLVKNVVEQILVTGHPRQQEKFRDIAEVADRTVQSCILTEK
jgi:hypothetical protein